MGELADFSMDQIAGACALLLGSLGGLCLILFKSRCEKISVCWGAWTCDRKVPDIEPQPEPEPEPEPEPIIPNNNP
jgi:hypothetical protein